MLLSDLASILKADCNSSVSMAEIEQLIAIKHSELLQGRNQLLRAPTPYNLTINAFTSALPSDIGEPWAIVEVNDAFAAPSSTPMLFDCPRNLGWGLDAFSGNWFVFCRPYAEPRYVQVWYHYRPSVTMAATDNLLIPDTQSTQVLRSAVMAEIEARIEGNSVYWRNLYRQHKAEWNRYCNNNVGVQYQGDTNSIEDAFIM